VSRARALAFSGFAGNTVWLVGGAFMMGVIAPDATGAALPATTALRRRICLEGAWTGARAFEYVPSNAALTTCTATSVR